MGWMTEKLEFHYWYEEDIYLFFTVSRLALDPT